jgi:hypothetical protein
VATEEGPSQSLVVAWARIMQCRWLKLNGSEAHFEIVLSGLAGGLYMDSEGQR